MPKLKVKKNIQGFVMDKIRRERISIRPRIYFIVGSFLFAAGLFFAIFLAVFFANVAIFRFSGHSPFVFLCLGRPGLGPFISSVPWLSLFVAVLGMTVGLFILKRYDFSYKNNYLLIVVGLTAMVLTLGFILSTLKFNEKISEERFLKPFYRQKYLSSGWIVGKVEDTRADFMRVVTPGGRQVGILFDEDTEFPRGEDIKTGDTVYAVGEWEGDKFKATKVAERKQGNFLRMQKEKGMRRSKSFFLKNNF